LQHGVVFEHVQHSAKGGLTKHLRLTEEDQLTQGAVHAETLRQSAEAGRSYLVSTQVQLLQCTVHLECFAKRLRTAVGDVAFGKLQNDQIRVGLEGRRNLLGILHVKK
jgi:predicted HAD superfamily phosphohydrolase